MTDEELAAIRQAPGASRRLESGAFLHAVRPIAADLASMLLFYLVLLLTGDVRAGTVLGMALGVLQIAVLVVRRQPIPAMLAASVLLLVSLGGLTLWLHNPRFVLIKTSIFYFVIGGTMLRHGWRATFPRLPPGAFPRG